MIENSQVSNGAPSVCPSGTWCGYWLQGGRQWPMWATLEFTTAGMSGGGGDAVGPFRVVGGYGEDGIVFWIKSYGVRWIHYRGHYDARQRCISGKYRSDVGGGGHFWLFAPQIECGTGNAETR